MVYAPLVSARKGGKVADVIQHATKGHLVRTVSRYATVRATQHAAMQMESVQMTNVLQDGKDLTAIQNAMMERLVRTAMVNVTA